jgi:hypothetical protein
VTKVLDKKEGVWEFFFYYRLVLRKVLIQGKKCEKVCPRTGGTFEESGGGQDLSQMPFD